MNFSKTLFNTKYMKAILSLVITSCLVISTWAQTKPKQKEKPPTQKEMQAMMKEAQDMMKDLSPEEKKMMDEGMKMVKDMQAAGKLPTGAGTVNTKIPAKQTALLGKIPRLSTTIQYKAYLSALKQKATKTIAKNIRDEVETAINKQINDPIALNNLPPSFFMEKKPTAAIYAAIRIAQENDGKLLSQNNLAVILHQSGYPQYAIPVLENLLSQNKSAFLLNNVGQCYLSLGDKEKAIQYFMACLKLDANNAEANCGTALILVNEGKLSEAIPHIHKAMKNGYSEVLEKLCDEKKINLNYDDLRCKVPEYFNPNKYKPVPAAKKMDEIKNVLTQREEIDALVGLWQEKDKKEEEEQSAKMEKETFSQLSSRVYGLFPSAPFGKKAKFMILQNAKAMSDWAIETRMDGYNNEVAVKNMHNELDHQIAQIHKNNKVESEYEGCKIKAGLVNSYLAKSSEFHEAYVRKTLHKYYDYTNQQLYWYQYLLNEDHYKIMFYGIAADLMEQLKEYNKVQQLYPTPDYVVTHCEKILQNPPKPQVLTEMPNWDCPIKTKIPLGFGSVKMDCKGWEIEGGELLMLGMAKDYRTGEFTFGFGLGATIDVPGMGIGGKGQMFFKFGSDGSPLDCGMVFEAGGEATAGPVMIAEEKITAVIGMTSGVHVDAVHAGQQVNIFELDPSK